MLIVVAAVKAPQGKMSYFRDETSGKTFLGLFGGLFAKVWFHFIEMAWVGLGLPPVMATELTSWKTLVCIAVAMLLTGKNSRSSEVHSQPTDH